MKTYAIKDAIGVFGAASEFSEAQVIAAFRVGSEIAKHDYNLVTGATLGLPYSAAIGAKLGGAVVVGVSPAESREEHVRRFKRPLDYADVIIFTGMGLEGRQPISVRSVRGAIFIAGEFGTLAEFSAAWTVGHNVLGILEGFGGISDYLREIISRVQSEYGSVIIYDSNPVELVRRVCEEIAKTDGLNPYTDDIHSYGDSVREVIRTYLKESGSPELRSDAR
jgi:uncharacterized protein (TIGR00725 family)